MLMCYVPTTYMISTEVYLTDLMWKITEWRNGNFGLQINNIAYNAYIYDLFAYPNPFFYRVTRYGFFIFYIVLKNWVRIYDPLTL